MSCPGRGETRGRPESRDRESSLMPRYRDESLPTKWDQLKQYEEEAATRTDQPGPGLDFRHYERSNSLLVVRTFQQIRESSSKTYSNIKNQVTELYR